MAEFEELKLVVNLTDNASAGLITLRNQLANVQQAATASVPAFQNIARHTSNFGTQVKGLAAELQKLTSSIPFLGVQLGGLTPHFETLIAKMPMFTRGALLAGSGVAALAVGVYRLGNSLGEFSKGQIALAALARTLGSTSGQIKVMVDQMRGVFSPEEAKQQIAIFGEWVQDISRAGSELAAKFRQTYGDAGDEMMRHVIEMYDSGKIEEAWNYYVTTMRKSLATTTAQVGAQAAGGYLEEAMSKELGGPGTSSRVLDLPDIKPATEEQKKEAEQRLAQARSMLAAWNDLEVAIERLGQQVEASLLPYMTEVAGN